MTLIDFGRKPLGAALLFALTLVPGVAAETSSGGGNEFSGAVTALPGTAGQIGDWVVSGKTVHVSATTVVSQLASISVGTTVSVHGVLNADATVTATGIQPSGAPAPQGYDFSGSVSVLPGTTGQIGTWTVGTKTVNVTASTVFPAGQLASIAVGSSVNIQGILNADGTVTALLVSLRNTPPPQQLSQGYELHGAVAVLPGTAGQIGNWTVGTTTVQVTASTVFPAGQLAAIVVGTQVDVQGTRNADGSVTAAKISAIAVPAPVGYNFNGVVSALPGTTGQIGNWMVGGKTVTVTSSTMFPAGQLALIAVNSVVDVSGVLNADGSVTALRISLENTPNPPPSSGYDLQGAIVSLPTGGSFVGNWVVGSVTVQVTATTVLPANTAAIVVGAQVDVHGTRQADGSVLATSITVATGGRGGHRN